MGLLGVGLLGVATLWATALAPQAESSDRIYGRVVTAEGDHLEGYLRWDRNETHWVDFLDGRKEIPWAWVREAERLDDDFRQRRERERSLTVLGVRISWDEDEDEPPPTSTAAVRFGHLRSLEVLDERRARLVLRSGEDVVLTATSSDLGPAFRGLIVEDGTRGEVELRWRELDRVEFLAAPAGGSAPGAERLHGTLRTRSGVELTGFVAWDLDETLSTDVLDGEEGGRERDVSFGDVARIAREGSRSARVTLRTGEELLLRGTNDVNDENRGVEISDAAFGRAVVSWDELDALTFHAPARGAGYDLLDGGRRLTGVVETSDGRRLVGRIRWDNDEEAGWEVLDGRSDGVDYDIEMALVQGVERVGSSAARVTLRDGRAFLLEGSNDVSDTNKGIFVQTSSNEMALAHWRDVVRVTFDE